ncbi:major facilitator superfamily domain-containing protein [Stachybotrys elegans]|uniref:Major facilitator superfamily domain-containing protein n=1 Tax=Stachybotrys elegans TaxID=80388 RepID=A0A8K0SKQ1_9HYPO|nr:major facilitator superfamily domain-containing protein [Stachybotrys elegans]
MLTSVRHMSHVVRILVQYWVAVSLAVYGAALLVSSPIWGLLADRIRNRRIPMLFGLVLLAGATVFLCLSSNIAMLLMGRTLQGFSAALTWTVGLALVIDTVDSKRIGVATGWIGMSTSVAILSAPLVGGVVYGHGGYYSVFAMCFGLLAVDIALRLIIVEVKEARRWLEPAEALPAVGDASGVEQSKSGTAKGDEPVVTGASSGDQLQASRPSILRQMWTLLRKPRLLGALWGTLVHALIQTSFDSILPLFVEETFGWNSTGAGLVFLPLVLPTFLSPLIGALGDRYGPKWLATGGFLLATPFLVCLRFVENDSINHIVLLCGLLVGIGVAIALVFGPLMAEITWTVQEDHADSSVAPYALAYGFYSMAFSGGALIGPILGGMVRDSAGWPTVGWALAIVSFVTSITQLIWIGGPLRQGRSS